MTFLKIGTNLRAMSQNRAKTRRQSKFPLTLALALILGVSLLPSLVADAQTPAFNDPGFSPTWQRVDKPVQDNLSGLNRGYTWGPGVADTGAIVSEPYNGTVRRVQYFDKARMEVNNPAGNPADLYYVTTGLLVKELVSGQRQDGDNSFTPLPASPVQVAGDPNDNGANAVAPTYASFQKLDSFAGNPTHKAGGQTITQAVNRAGEVSGITPVENRTLKGYDEVTGHNIADVFVDFANARGPVWNGSSFVTDALFFGNPTYVLGRPLTEPYWTQAVVAGLERDVLVQLFERRVLTYTPTNPAPYRVEMGNVGQHYYKWRYILNDTTPTSNPAPVPASNPGGASVGGSNVSVSPNTDYAGRPFLLSGTGFKPGETIKLWSTDPQSKVSGLVDLTSDASGNFTYTYISHGPLAGVWAITAHGVTSGKEAIGYLKLVDFVPDNGQGAKVELSRSHGNINDKIDIHGSNFSANERYSYWITAPDGKVFGGEQTPSYRHTSHHGEVNLIGYALPIVESGRWAITVYGQYSQRIAVAYFTYDQP